MLKLNTIRGQIFTIFGILIVILVVNAIVSYYIFQKNSELSQKISTTISPSVLAIKDFENIVLESKTLATNWIYLSQNQTVKKQLSDIHVHRYPDLKRRLQELSEVWDNNFQKEQMALAFKEFEKVLISEKGIMGALVDFEDYNQAQLKFESMTVLEDEVIPPSDKLIVKLSGLFIAKNNELIEYNSLFLQSENTLKNSILGLSAVLILLAISFAVYMSRLITRPIVSLRKVINSLGKGELQKPDLLVKNNEIGQMIQSVSQLTDALKTTTEFANKIGNRDFTADFEPLSPKDDLGYALLTMRDNIRKSEEQLIRARDEAEHAVAAKSQFLSNMSHEIRTPMNAIIGLTELLINEPYLTEKQWENLSSIKLSAENLLEIINDILDISKIDSGKLNIQYIDFNIRDVVAQTVKIAGIKAKEKDLYINFVVADQIPSWLKGDSVRLNQILLNLVHNAVKFTEKGFVKLKVSIVEQNFKDSKIKLLFEVIDTGIGIPYNKQEEIFESFKQLRDDNSRKWGGTGLGLAITKKLADLMGGKIGVESIVNQGSRFYVEIPFGVQETTAINTSFTPNNAGHPTNQILQTQLQNEAKLYHHQKPSEIVDKKSLSGKKVLIVEDNYINQILMVEIMKKWEAEYQVAINGEEALKELEKVNYDIVLMDLQMPVMDGYEATKNIRDFKSNILNHDIPIIAVSADAYEATRMKALETGMNDYISKPFTHEGLYEIITTYIN